MAYRSPGRFDLLTRRFAFAQDLFRALVGSKPQINGMAHFAGVRPLGEFHFCHKGGLYPGGNSFASHLFWKRRFSHLQFDQLAVKFF